MSLTPGQKLGHFEIIDPIGKGGMGEVYRAKDTKLGRDVAIKVLPRDFLDDAERVARFEREARLLAALNHPNIATIHGIEESESQRFLVMELVEGETLAERIARGAIPLGEALPLFEQIARGLEAAHEKDVIHRDLKPPNIIVSPNGTPKLLDFGLAKAYGSDTAEAGLSQSPTISRGTAVGVILGTAPYMSPEQARGKSVDKRTDIWAFGCCWYEALTGKPAFMGETVTDTIAKIVEREPDWNALPGRMPARIHELLRRCLQKDSGERLRDIGDARIEIRAARTEPEPTVSASEASSRSRTVLAIAGPLLGGALLASLLVSWWLPLPEAPVVRFGIPLAPTDRLTDPYGRVVAFSPSGNEIAYAANDMLYLRTLDEFKATPLAGTEGGRSPFFSPDREWLGFFASGKLMKLPLRGGDPMTLCDAEGDDIGSADWGPRGVIAFTDRARILRVSENGGAPDILIELDAQERASSPQFVQDGETLLFTIREAGAWGTGRIGAQSLSTGERRIVLEAGIDARYIPTGHLLFVREETIWAAPFDSERLEITGGGVPVLDRVRGARFANNTTTGSWKFSVSTSGSLVFVPGSKQELAWVDRQGRVEPLTANADEYYWPRLSPDSESLAYVSESDVWIYDFRRGTASRLTFTADNNWPIWTPDGNDVIFVSSRDGVEDIFSKAADGGADARIIIQSEMDHRPEAVSPDGRFLVYRGSRDKRWDIFVWPLDGQGEPRPFRETPFSDYGTEFSPDGQWVAYTSNESGRHEVYAQPFPGPGGKILVSTEGGGGPMWSRDGRELFYIFEETMMAVEVGRDHGLSFGNPKPLFQGEDLGRGILANYDVALDGERFLVVRSTEAITELKVVLNWTEELKRLVPVD